MTPKKKIEPRRIILTAGQAVRLQRESTHLSALYAEVEAARRRTQVIMDEILIKHDQNGNPPSNWTLEVDGDKVELVEVLADGSE